MDLDSILADLPRDIADPNLLVGLDPADDAAVYQIAEDRALVLTVDVITPIVDDPRDYGTIAATNALSDVFAMGGRPLAALNIACIPQKLPPAAAREIFAGASDAVRAAGALIVGGHTIKDPELKYGLAIVGEVHPDRILTNAGAQIGDVILLTKPLGTAVLATALRAGDLDEASPQYSALRAMMTQSNGPAAEILARHGCHALTDVTGFGLSGHGREVADASGVSLRFDLPSVPVLPGAFERLVGGLSCGGAQGNAERAEGTLDYAAEIDPTWINLIHDPQTSGPLLATIPADRAESVLADLITAGFPEAKKVGEVIASSGKAIHLR